MKLYEITGEIQALLDGAIDGEIDASVIDALEESLETKVKNIVGYIRNMDSDNTVIDAEILRLTELKARRVRAMDWLKNYLKNNMEALGLKKFETPLFIATIKKNPPSVIIDDPVLVPVEFIRERIVKEIDKAKIKETWKAGVGVDGTHIEQRERLEIK